MELKKSDYESYDYREFWEDNKRVYEDASERLALEKFFKGVNQSGTIVDIGCGYGRLFNIYQGYDRIIMLDYSLNNLKNTKETIKNFLKQNNNKIADVYFIAADAANLPIKNEAVDAAISVRLIHHLNNPGKFISETGRILKNNGLFILEFANKRNIKNIVKFIFGKLKESPFSSNPYRIGETIHDNHPKVIVNYLKSNFFEVKKVLSVSNLRTGFLKRRLKIKNLLMLENFTQICFSSLKLAPSIFVKSYAQKFNNKNKAGALSKPAGKFEDFLLCPKCRNMESGMGISGDSIICNFCGAEFKITDGIYDLRIL